MQEIEAKKQLKASEGAHFFYTLIFLSASGIIENQFIQQQCNQNIQLFIHLIFYGLIIWGTYILITLIPRYRNAAINFFFNFLDICFAVYIFILLIMGLQQYLDPINDCQLNAPVLYFFQEMFILVNGIIFAILFLAFISYILRRFSKAHHTYPEEEEFNDA